MASCSSTPADALNYGGTPLVCSAPHCIPLQRDGHPDHKREDYTRFLAQCFAETAGGAALVWSKEEEARLKAECGGKAAPQNRCGRHSATQSDAHLLTS